MTHDRYDLQNRPITEVTLTFRLLIQLPPYTLCNYIVPPYTIYLLIQLPLYTITAAHCSYNYGLAIFSRNALRDFQILHQNLDKWPLSDRIDTILCDVRFTHTCK